MSQATLATMQTELTPVRSLLQERASAEHLVVMVNGLNGCPTNWNVLKQSLKSRLKTPKETVFYASHSNRKLRTLAGICTCADRLSRELQSVLETYPDLKEISFVVHSMGGLISRYAIGVNFDPSKRTVFGLHPRHFMAIATPHLGCDVEGESQVPFLGWGQAIPIIGPLILRPLIRLVTPFIMKHIYRRTGQQLFLMDGKPGGQDPLICRLVQDIPGEGYFLSALKEFKTRTLYANVRHDALVGWENASLRRNTELPRAVDMPLSPSITYRMDALENALWSDHFDGLEVSLQNGKVKRERVEYMLKQLQSLPWCRIDICFRNCLIPLLAHSHIQVTRKWIDSAGMPVIKHIAKTFANLESLVSEHQP